MCAVISDRLKRSAPFSKCAPASYRTPKAYTDSPDLATIRIALSYRVEKDRKAATACILIERGWEPGLKRNRPNT
jgi:hypothetical protein